MPLCLRACLLPSLGVAPLVAVGQRPFLRPLDAPRASSRVLETLWAKAAFVNLSQSSSRDLQGFLQRIRGSGPRCAVRPARALGVLRIRRTGLPSVAVDDRVLERLATDAKRQKDEGLLEAIEDALGTASMSGGNLYLMKMDDEDE